MYFGDKGSQEEDELRYGTLQCLVRFKIFLWLVKTNRILTKDNIKKKRMAGRVKFLVYSVLDQRMYITLYRAICEHGFMILIHSIFSFITLWIFQPIIYALVGAIVWQWHTGISGLTRNYKLFERKISTTIYNLLFFFSRQR